ncbi:inactive rhomboid protein 1-like isoform X2 [Dendronephthya gigantea]|uniref:inactive rhomboid protein 1-like isoform X2 n=1 Tax=Dendronephthya gigantea TaxID=151771 RepID=UPI00106AC8CC|nr:inactive rhomboid protein 1-like isoform X2 [Dendronephthya gigantea]
MENGKAFVVKLEKATEKPSQLCRPMPCMPAHSTSGPVRSTSKASLGSTLEREAEPAKPSATAGSKWNIVRSKIKKGTEEFFCLCEDDQKRQLLEQKWMARRNRYCSKRYGPLNTSQLGGDATPRFPSISSGRSQQNVFTTVMSVSPGQPGPPVLERTKSRKESVASMAWQGLKNRIIGGDFSSAMSHGEMIGKGRSFAPATLAHLVHDEEDGVFESAPNSPRSFRADIDDEVFFDFIGGAPGSTQSSLPAIREDDEIDAPREHASPKIDITPELPEKLRLEKPDESPPPPLPEKKRIGRPPEERVPLPFVEPSDSRPRLNRQISTASQRGNRIIRLPVAPVPSGNRREIGKGLVGRWLNRTIKRKRLTSSVKKQLDSMEDHRPYFTYWISFVQTSILIITLAVYGFAPVGLTVSEEVARVHRSRGGYLTEEKVSTKTPDNFWIGLSRDALIQLGAKYAPCMRKDKELQRMLDRERKEEAETGCCIGTDQNGCIQTSQEMCKKTFSTLYKYRRDNKSRAVCGQDPIDCVDPPSVEPNKWSPNDITEWPICKRLTQESRNNTNKKPDHLNCKITGRPCCIRDQAECRIISREYCEFLNGVYHDEATLCSQVDCLGTTCGLLPFLHPETPDQIYRLWLSLFLHAGILHLLITLIFHFTILKDMEKMAGWLRIAIIYIFSGIGGNLLSAIITPYQPEVGPSGALFGIIACLLVELVQNWQMIKEPWSSVLKLGILTFLLVIFGCLPWVDNFAHLGGLMFGTLLGFAFLPYITFGEWDRRRKLIQIVVSIGLTVAIFIVLCIVFFVDQESTCSGCHYINCIPFKEDFCSPSLSGRGLSPRVTS